MRELLKRSKVAAAVYVVATGLLAIAGAGAAWALFTHFAPGLDFGLVFFVSLLMGILIESIASSYLKRILREQSIEERKRERQLEKRN